MIRSGTVERLLAGAVLAALASGCVSVAVSEPPFGPEASAYRPAGPERVVVISAVRSELELLLAAAQVEETLMIAGRRHHVGWLAGHPVVLFLGGVSLVNAAMATQAVIDRFPVSAIVFSGIAGGVNPNLSIGDVVVPARWGQFQETVFARETADGWETDGRAGEIDNFGMMFPRGQLVPPEHADPEARTRRFWFDADPAMLRVAEQVSREVQLAACTPNDECLEHEPAVFVGGNGVSGSVFVNNAEFREYLWRTFQADAVDMETAAIAQVAYVNGVPFLGFRSLSDLAGGGPGSNQIQTFGVLASDNSARVLLRFLADWE